MGLYENARRIDAKIGKSLDQVLVGRPKSAEQKALEDAEDYHAFEAAIIADYDAQSAVERELVLRLANLLWRLRRAATMETGLFQAEGI